jgi:hypothetical protein
MMSQPHKVFRCIFWNPSRVPYPRSEPGSKPFSFRMFSAVFRRTLAIWSFPSSPRMHVQPRPFSTFSVPSMNAVANAARRVGNREVALAEPGGSRVSYGLAAAVSPPRRPGNAVDRAGAAVLDDAAGGTQEDGEWANRTSTR